MPAPCTACAATATCTGTSWPTGAPFGAVAAAHLDFGIGLRLHASEGAMGWRLAPCIMLCIGAQLNVWGGAFAVCLMSCAAPDSPQVIRSHCQPQHPTLICLQCLAGACQQHPGLCGQAVRDGAASSQHPAASYHRSVTCCPRASEPGTDLLGSVWDPSISSQDPKLWACLAVSAAAWSGLLRHVSG